MTSLKYFSLLLIIHYCDVITTTDDFTSMKIVNEISSNGAWQQNQASVTNNQLTLQVQPRQFIGPAHLRPLADECFDYVQSDYRYRLCPFHNVTQHEVTSRWNAYQGVLGVWERWKIVDDRFASLHFHKGDKCGGKGARRVEVQLECGDDDVTTHVTSVEEWEECKYLIKLKSPMFCARMGVYDFLNETMRSEKLEIEQDFVDGFLTPRGYEEKIRHFYSRLFPVAPAEEEEKFDSVDTCNEEYSKLLHKVAKLEKELEEMKNK